jgi:HlyD family secretion protein
MKSVEMRRLQNDILNDAGKQNMDGLKRNYALLSVLAISAGILGCQSNSDQKTVPETNHAVAVKVATVSITKSPIIIDAVGTISARFVSELSSRALEKVTAVYVKEGDTIRKGEPLVALDTRALESAEAQAVADVQSSIVQFKSTQTNLDMASSTSQDQVKTAQAQVAAAQAALQSAQDKKNLVDVGPRLQEKDEANFVVSSAQASLVLAQKTYARMTKLYSEDAITGQQLDQSKSEIDAAQASYQVALQRQSMIEEGSRVEDRASADAAVSQARASLAAAQSMLSQSRDEAEIVNIRKDDLDQANLRLIQSNAGLSIAKANLSYATILAPYDGVVVERDADPGVMAGPGIPLLKIQGGDLRLDASVPESAVSQVVIGSSVPVTIDALGSRKYMAKVLSISPQGDSSSHTFMIKATLPSLSGVREGMFGRAIIKTGTTDSLTIPSSSVVNREGLTYVYVITNNVTQLRLVSLGQTSGTKVAVLSGLQLGDKVAASNVTDLTDNELVREVD